MQFEAALLNIKKILPFLLDINVKKMAPKLSTKEILQQNMARKHPKNTKWMVWAHNIRSLHNIGAIFRSSDAFGVDEIILSGFSPKPDRPEVNKTAIGAEEFVTWSYFEKWESALNYITKQNVQIVGLEQTNQSIPLPEYEIPENQDLCIVLGNEVSGIEDDLLSHLNHCVEIPQYGNKHSLNVSVAAGITLFGMLDKCWRKKSSQSG